ncbi:MAG TPA: ATP-binding protein [Bacilli bacterium]|nr:ATP-binding protein [Bacilli bacterium]
MNLLLILSPVFFYQIFMVDRVRTKTHKSQWVLGALCGVSACLCMTYPINVGDEFMWDLRWIPFLVAILYGGVRGGLVATVLSLGYRLNLGGGMAFYTVVADVLVLFPLVWLLRRRFLVWSRVRKLVGSAAVSLGCYVFVMTSIAFYFWDRHDLGYMAGKGVWFYSLYALTYAVAMLCAVALLEVIFENEKMREEVQRSEKLSIISELAASIAHEVRNPLTVVRGFIQLASQGMDERNRGYMGTAISELDRAEFIISDYLNFAKPEVDQKERVDLAQELGHVVTVMGSFANLRGVRLEEQLEGELFVVADRVKFKQAVMNLIKNSIEAMQGDGTVCVKAFREQGDVVVQVLDDGEGMTVEELERLGKPFYSTKDRGTGLGLMVTFRIVEAMGGELVFESEKGVGTVATVRVEGAV